MDNHRLRAIILKLQDRLSNDDRKRLHFYLGNDVPRRIRDDSTLGGTLSLMDSLFDQDKVNEKDFTFLINAFDEIQCIDAVKLLREHWRHNQSDIQNQSVESLSMIMPAMINQLLEDQDEDKYSMQQLVVNPKNTCDNSNIMINSNNTNINQIPVMNNDEKPQHPGSKRKYLLNSRKMLWKCLLLFVLLSIVGYGILISFSIQNFVDIGRKIQCLEILNNVSMARIQLLETSNSQSIETIEHLQRKVKQLKKPQPKWDKWNQNAITVAGGNEKGQQLNQLYGPEGIFVDKNKNIFIADIENHRIVEWKHDAKEGQIIAGGNKQGNRTDQLNRPTDVIFDQQNHSIIITDKGNSRVIQWSNQNQQILIDNIHCSRLAMDKYGFLYVSDCIKNEVRRWKMGEYNNEGIIVAGGNGRGNQLNQLNCPSFLFVDEDQSVYVSDFSNHRVMKWRKDTNEGRIVAGGNGRGESLNQLFGPRGVITDHLGQIYVTDRGNDRIMRWCEGKEEGEVVVGGNSKGNQSSQLNGPVGISFDGEGNLYVADYFNHRIQKFEHNRFDFYSDLYVYMYSFIAFIVQINSQICEKTPQYGECSTNSACGCFHMVGANDDTGVCGFLWPTCSRLLQCNSSNNSCSQPNTICVQHPQCDDFPLCYPITMFDQNMCPPIKNKINLKWKQNAITVAGGIGYGEQLNQLRGPQGIFIDKNKNIFIADGENHRIVEWKHGAKQGQTIAGRNGAGSQMDQLYCPTDMIVDQQNHSIIIADSWNRRVIQWFNQNQQILIKNIDCNGLAMDKNGFLYVSNYKKNEVRRWKMGEYNNAGVVVAGGNGQGDRLNQLSFPRYIFIDEDQSVYVTDRDNHRVMKWRKDAKEGTVVAGGNGQGRNLNQLSSPQGIIFDDLGQIYVADFENHRIMRWYEGKEEGEVVVGGNSKEGNQSNQLNGPLGISFDDERNLYVADCLNHRIQKFEIIL
ncbi:unnamed protein product [Adineta steineri]|uniref:DED domain-containing protein n=1 Tax=Adineta steineri TaxID=433720 RepID=A0A819AK61_9BILA|nr:unnamed protein product [Adineta steineri]CAF3778861.1 unnamed protein product [Adineta steineri]